MRKSRFTEEQIAYALQQAEYGTQVADFLFGLLQGSVGILYMAPHSFTEHNLNLPYILRSKENSYP